MARRRALPEGLDPRVRNLAQELRRLLDRRELSVARLAARTSYGKASWERYLTGRALPPRQAVEELAHVCGVEPIRLVALQEVAADAWTTARAGRADEQEKDQEEDDPDDRQHSQDGSRTGAQDEAAPAEISPKRSHPHRAHFVLTAALVILAVAAGVLFAVRPWQDGHSTAAPHYTCHVTRSSGGWQAGLSSSSTRLVQWGMAGPEVAEVQCLLRRAGFSPGDVDGVFGELTLRAVKRFQTRHSLVADGIVGPKTWGSLRR